MKIHQTPWLMLAVLLALPACTQETQNEISRGIQNWTGTNGVLDVYAGDKLVQRFIRIDKISTAYGTDDNKPRAYRYGYGYVDVNQNFIVDSGEKKVYFEISDLFHQLYFLRKLQGLSGYKPWRSSRDIPV